MIFCAAPVGAARDSDGAVLASRLAVNPGEVLLLGIALVGSVWAMLSYQRATRVTRERQARERQGAKNAAQARRALAETCVVCGEPVTAAHDLYDEKTQTWWHGRCWRESVR
jgi:hypothetical protein